MGQSIVVGALPGQTVVIRYLRLPDMPDSQLPAAVEEEAGKQIPYERSEVFLDSAPLDRVTEGDATTLKALLVAAKTEVIDRRVEVADAADVSYAILGVDSLALVDAAEACDFLRVGESVALVNLGSTTTSIHFVKDGISNFIRDVNWGARELIVAISKARRCEFADAERLLLQQAPSGQESEEPAVAGPEEDIRSIKPEQPEEPEPMGGSLLEPLDEELGDLADLSDLGDSSPSSPAPSQPPSADEKDLEDTLSMPLGRLVSEIRRSFDYYEQQLYEKPVERLILSGGAAQIPAVHNTLVHELGVEHIELANPLQSALIVGNEEATRPLTERPAQFLVAVGLAARGTMEL
jgi:type IV pilus assembly protein PilM